MDLRIGRPLPSSQIALTSPNPDGNPSGSGAGGWSFDAQTPQENQQREKSSGREPATVREQPADGDGLAAGLGGGADGSGGAAAGSGGGGQDPRPVGVDPAYQQYGRRGRVENALVLECEGPVSTFVMDRTEGVRLDIRV